MPNHLDWEFPGGLRSFEDHLVMLVAQVYQVNRTAESTTGSMEFHEIERVFSAPQDNNDAPSALQMETKIDPNAPLGILLFSLGSASLRDQVVSS